jgi:hypothetical protein
MNVPKYIWNPKTKDSGIITCIPQTGECPNRCPDCFFQSGRSYLEPLSENLPQIPPIELAEGRVVRMNDGNDSNVDRALVYETAKKFKDYFFNTSIPDNIGTFPGPVVLTVNPGLVTDYSFHKVEYTPNLMFVRLRVNAWNIENIVKPAVEYYSNLQVPIVLTFMAYYTEKIPDEYRDWYEWKKRTLNSYWVMKRIMVDKVENMFWNNPYVYTCGWKGQYSCRLCGNCLREYFSAKERMRALEENGK